MEHIIDSITGTEPWIAEVLKRLELDGDIGEASSRRVAILEHLRLIERLDNFGLDYAITKAGTLFLYHPEQRSNFVAVARLLNSANMTKRPVSTNGV
jgi:hypothetical protein